MKRQVSDLENKLVLLYALKALGPATDLELWSFLSASDSMNYFDMQMNLQQLQAEGQIRLQPHPLAPLLALSETGGFTLESFLHRLPLSRRNAVDSAAAIWRPRFRAEQEALAESMPLQGSRQGLRLRLLEKENPVLEMLLTLPEGMRINRLQERWQRCAQALYSRFMSCLFASQESEEPEGTVLQPVQDGWLVMLDSPDLTLILSLPQEEIARHFAKAWPLQAAGLRDQACRMLDTAMDDPGLPD